MKKYPINLKMVFIVLLVLAVALLAWLIAGKSSDGDTQKSAPKTTLQKSDEESEEDSNNSASLTEITPDVKAAGLNAAVSGCDENLWEHIYNPSRLIVINKCVAVNGVIEKIKYNEDGDAHIDVRLDTGYSGMVNDYNESGQDGDLVVESVCDHKPTADKADDICDNFTSNISVPPKGSHVYIKGTFVLDTHNGWTEIHPVSTINVK